MVGVMFNICLYDKEEKEERRGKLGVCQVKEARRKYSRQGSRSSRSRSVSSCSSEPALAGIHLSRAGRMEFPELHPVEIAYFSSIINLFLGTPCCGNLTCFQWMSEIKRLAI